MMWSIYIIGMNIQIFLQVCTKGWGVYFYKLCFIYTRKKKGKRNSFIHLGMGKILYLLNTEEVGHCEKKRRFSTASIQPMYKMQAPTYGSQFYKITWNKDGRRLTWMGTKFTNLSLNSCNVCKNTWPIPNKMCTDILGLYYPHSLWKGLYSKFSFPQTSPFLFVHNYNDGVAPSVWQVPDNRSIATLSISPSRDILLYILNNGVTPFLYKGSVHYRRKKKVSYNFFTRTESNKICISFFMNK